MRLLWFHVAFIFAGQSVTGKDLSAPNIQERVAVVTGAAQGIGREIFLTFAREPYKAIVCVDRTADHCRETLELGKQLRLESQIAGNLTTFFASYGADLGNLESVQSTAARILADRGRVDVIVNNAGITRDKLLISMSDADWEDVIDTNLNGAVYMTQFLMPAMMKAQWGRIVNISSIVALRGNAGQTNYAASKAALIGFTKALAREMAPRNILVNAVAPGFVETAMTEKMTSSAMNNVLSKNPTKRLGKPSEIAATVAFLASDMASYMSGSVVPVDGGQLL